MAALAPAISTSKMGFGYDVTSASGFSSQNTMGVCQLHLNTLFRMREGKAATNVRTKWQAQAASTITPSVKEEELVQLGQSDVRVSRIGVGAWSWGDTLFWNNGSWSDQNVKAVKGAFDASMDAGLTFFDTAEVYGGKWTGGDDSESLLGRAIKDRQRQGKSGKAVVATKFAALPWRFTKHSVLAALRDSLSRLGLESVDLYQLHWPGLWGNEGYIDGLGDAVEQGLVKAVGVSNYSEKRLRAAHAQLAKRGIPLASNQVFIIASFTRLPEENGVKKTCEELGITLIAYSPLGQGILTGKYSATNIPSGPRGRIYNEQFLTRAAPLLKKMKEIGQQYDKSSTQVALNWLLAQGNVVPIPGAKSASQANEFAGALGWSLTKDEVQELHTLAKTVQPVRGFPVEAF